MTVEIVKSADQLAELLANTLRLTHEKRGSEHVFTSETFFREDTEIFLSESYLDSIIAKLGELTIDDVSVILANKLHYEVIVRHTSVIPIGLSSRRAEGMLSEDTENNIKYALRPMSDELFVALLHRIPEYFISDPRFTRRVGSVRVSNSESQRIENLEPIKRAVFPSRMLTLQIDIQSAFGMNFERLEAAFLFHLAYNLDISLVPVKTIDELTSRTRLPRNRRSRQRGDIDPPRRYFRPELTRHYQLGVSSESPQLAYLSYYHVAEHFFETVFYQDIVERIQNILTQPSFSYRRPSDTRKIIDEVSRSVRIRKSDDGVNEEKALYLTLRRFVPLSELVNELRGFDEDMIEFFRTKVVGFASVPTIDFDDTDQEVVLKKISKRIYLIRNAIVHSKGETASKFKPFHDDRELSREVILVRLIAEQIVINTAAVIEGGIYP